MKRAILLCTPFLILSNIIKKITVELEHYCSLKYVGINNKTILMEKILTL
jgi:hypothetical protein